MGVHLREREAQERAKMAQDALGNQAQMMHTLIVSVSELMQRVTAAEVMIARLLKINDLDPNEIIEEFIARTSQAVEEINDIPEVVVEERIDE